MSCNNCCYKNYDDNEYFCEYHMKHIIDYDMDCPDTQDEFISITNVFDRLNEFKHLCKINGACVTEYKKLLKAKDELELYKIIFYNIEWINDCNIFKESYVYLVDSDDFIDDLDLDSLGHIKIKYFDNKTNLSSIKTINGDVLLENIQDYYSIHSDLIQIRKDDLYGVIHKNDLKPIVPIIYNYISDFYNYDENVKFFIVSENKYKHLYSYDIESECSVEIELPKVNDELPTVIKSIDATNFNLSTHFILVYSNDKIILIDETGTPIIDMMSYKDLNYALEIDLKYDDCKLFHKN